MKRRSYEYANIVKTNLPWYIHASQEHLIHWDQQYPNIMQTVCNSIYCDPHVDASQNSMKNIAPCFYNF